MKNRKLNIYASGDGALSLVWIRNNIATGHPVTLADAQRAVNTRRDCYSHKLEQSLADKGYKIFQDGTYPAPNKSLPKATVGPWFVLFKAMTRRSADSVSIDGQVFRYTFERRPDDKSVFNVKAWTDGVHEDCKNAVREEYEVKHISTLSCIRWWLEHEERLPTGTIEPKRKTPLSAHVTAIREESKRAVEEIAASLGQ